MTNIYAFFSRSGEDAIEENLLKEFLKERLASGDFISKVSDILWNKDSLTDIKTDEENASLENSVNFVEVFN